MQWFKRFYEMSVQDKGDYDCAAVRLRGKGYYLHFLFEISVLHSILPSGGAEFNGTIGRAASGGGSSSASGSRGPRAASSRNIPATSTRSKPSTKTTSTSKATSASSAVAPAPSAATKKENPAPSAAIAAEIEELKAANEALSLSNSEKDMEMEGLEKERNFYFDKLRDIEMMLQDKEDNGEGTELTASIFKILYATAEGFDRVEDAPEEPVEDVGPPVEEPVVEESAVALDDDETY